MSQYWTISWNIEFYAVCSRVTSQSFKKTSLRKIFFRLENLIHDNTSRLKYHKNNRINFVFLLLSIVFNIYLFREEFCINFIVLQNALLNPVYLRTCSFIVYWSVLKNLLIFSWAKSLNFVVQHRVQNVNHIYVNFKYYNTSE